MPTVLGGTRSFFLVKSVCLVDYISNFLYLQLNCTKQYYIITVIPFTYQKVDKGTSQQVTAFVKHT